jgi:hypothetical protein
MKRTRLQWHAGIADIEIVMYVALAAIALFVISSCNRCVYRENLNRQGYEIVEVEEGSPSDVPAE